MQPQQLFQWRREVRERQGGYGADRFAAVRLVAGDTAGRHHEPEQAETDDRRSASWVEIRLDNGRVLRVRETIAPAALMTICRQLTRRRALKALLPACS